MSDLSWATVAENYCYLWIDGQIWIFALVYKDPKKERYNLMSDSLVDKYYLSFSILTCVVVVDLLTTE